VAHGDDGPVDALVPQPLERCGDPDADDLKKALLDKGITLILIEHDMDVALRVADRVTMMHDGRKMVEGTPEEIRANEMVHELYLGGRVAHADAEGA